MFHVYVLRSGTTGRHYVGQTPDLTQRLGQHNHGFTKSTENRGPWGLVHHEEFNTRLEAVRRERFLETGQGREVLRRADIRERTAGLGKGDNKEEDSDQIAAREDPEERKLIISRLPVGLGSYSTASANCFSKWMPWPPPETSSSERGRSGSRTIRGLNGGASSSTTRVKKPSRRATWRIIIAWPDLPA
jgi:putative endonuclease